MPGFLILTFLIDIFDLTFLILTFAKKTGTVYSLQVE